MTNKATTFPPLGFSNLSMDNTIEYVSKYFEMKSIDFPSTLVIILWLIRVSVVRKGKVTQKEVKFQEKDNKS